MARTSRYLDWQPTNFYGSTQNFTISVGTNVIQERVLFGSTQIAFFEDDFPLKRLVGHVKLSYAAAETATFRAVNVCHRIRMQMENQQTGALSGAGGDLDDQAVAEDSFLAEKRYRLTSHGTVANVGAYHQCNRNDFADLDPWMANWDVRVQRTFGLPWALVLSTRITSGEVGDSFSIVDYMRGLVRK